MHHSQGRRLTKLESAARERVVLAELERLARWSGVELDTLLLVADELAARLRRMDTVELREYVAWVLSEARRRGIPSPHDQGKR